MTKRQKAIVTRWENSYDYELYHVYNSYSPAKVNALEYCKSKQYELNGTRGRIISYNTFIFTYGFIFENADGLQFCYITPTRDEIFKLDGEGVY